MSNRLEDPLEVPGAVLQTLVRQLQVTKLDQLPHYRSADQRWEHTAEIRSRYGKHLGTAFSAQLIHAWLRHGISCPIAFE